MKYLQTLIISAILLVTTTAQAGVINKELAEKLAASPVTGQSDPNRSSLRCWQNGKLLFEEMDWQSFSVNNKNNVITFDHKVLDKQSLSLVDLGEAVCLYRKVEK